MARFRKQGKRVFRPRNEDAGLDFAQLEKNPARARTANESALVQEFKIRN